MESVEVAELGKVSVITLMLKQVLDRNLQDPRKQNVMKNRILTVQVHVRDMVMTLFFEADRVRAEEGAHGRPDIEISGDMQTLLSIAIGGSPLPAIFRRRLKIRIRRLKGYFYMLRLLLLLQLGKPPVYLKWLTTKEKNRKGPVEEP